MEPTSNDPSIAVAPFAHLNTMISALASATDPAERTMYLRGIARALEYITGKTHAAVAALVEAVRP